MQTRVPILLFNGLQIARELLLYVIAALLLINYVPAIAQTTPIVPTLNATGLPLLIAHRGASGYLPEHTLESYALAIELGADYVEPDLVATKDGVLIARHEPNLIATTDVSKRAEFANRKRKAVVDGFEEEGFFASDFTLAEIKQLRAVQAFSERDQSFNGLFQIPTLDEVIALVRRKGTEEGRIVGIYPETKHPTYHQKLGLALEPLLINVLTRNGLNRKGAPVFIQSFEVANLKTLRSLTPLPLIQLIDADDVAPDGSVTLAAPYDKPYDFAAAGDKRTFKDMLTPAGLKEIATYANGIGPWKPYILSSKCINIVNNACVDANGDGKIDERDRVLITPSTLVKDAHAAGLLVHAYTQRNEPRRLASNYNGNPINEFTTLYSLGIDGFFSDFTDTARTARYLFALKTNPDAVDCLVGAPYWSQTPSICRTLNGNERKFGR